VNEAGDELIDHTQRLVDLVIDAIQSVGGIVFLCYKNNYR